MLKRIELSQFRSCTHTVLDDMGGVLALVGRNGAGKTNVMRGITWAAGMATRTDQVVLDFGYLYPEPRFPSATIEFDTVVGKFRYAVSLSAPAGQDPVKAMGGPVLLHETLARLSVDSNEWIPLVARNGTRIELLETSAVLTIPSATPCLNALIALLPGDSPLSAQIRAVISFLSLVRYYALDAEDDVDNSQVIQHGAYEQWVEASKIGLDGNSSFAMRLLHMFLERKDDFSELQQLLGSTGLNLISSIDIIPLEIPQSPNHPDVDPAAEAPQIKMYFIAFRPADFGDTDRGKRFGFKELSYGTRRVTKILCSVLYDRSSVLLIEQPEDGIHSGLLHKLIPLFRAYSDRMQFIVASHSRDVLNRFLPQEVRLVSLKDGQTFVRHLDLAEVSAAEQFIAQDGPLSDFIESVEE